MVEVFARLGVTLLITEKERDTLRSGGEKAKFLLRRIVNEMDFMLDGESYIPCDGNEDEIVIDFTPDEPNEDVSLEYDGYRYEVVDEIPPGYTVCNIGSNGPDGYIPLCRPEPGICYGRAVDLNSLKAIRSEGADAVMKAVAYGAKTINQMRAYVDDYKDSKSKLVRERCSAFKYAIPYLEELPGIENLTAWRG